MTILEDPWTIRQIFGTRLQSPAERARIEI
jgi:hypothetical protein